MHATRPSDSPTPAEQTSMRRAISQYSLAVMVQNQPALTRPETCGPRPAKAGTILNEPGVAMPTIMEIRRHTQTGWNEARRQPRGPRAASAPHPTKAKAPGHGE